MHARGKRRSRETRETRAAAREEKRETARLARANELSVGLTTQNTIGWFVKRWQQTVNNRNHWQVDDGWSTAGKFVTFPEKKKNLGYGAKRSVSHARGHLRVSRFARRTTEKRETARSLINHSNLTNAKKTTTTTKNKQTKKSRKPIKRASKKATACSIADQTPFCIHWS